MNDNPHPIFQRALAPFTPLDVEPIKVGGTLLEPGNDAFVQHAITRERSGFGLSGWARVKCSCGFVGPKRFESDDSMMTKLCGDESAHINASRVMR